MIKNQILKLILPLIAILFQFNLNAQNIVSIDTIDNNEKSYWLRVFYNDNSYCEKQIWKEDNYLLQSRKVIGDTVITKQFGLIIFNEETYKSESIIRYKNPGTTQYLNIDDNYCYFGKQINYNENGDTSSYILYTSEIRDILKYEDWSYWQPFIYKLEFSYYENGVLSSRKQYSTKKNRHDELYQVQMGWQKSYYDNSGLKREIYLRSYSNKKLVNIEQQDEYDQNYEDGVLKSIEKQYSIDGKVIKQFLITKDSVKLTLYSKEDGEKIFYGSSTFVVYGNNGPYDWEYKKIKNNQGTYVETLSKEEGTLWIKSYYPNGKLREKVTPTEIIYYKNDGSFLVKITDLELDLSDYNSASSDLDLIIQNSNKEINQFSKSGLPIGTWVFDCEFKSNINYNDSIFNGNRISNCNFDKKGIPTGVWESFIVINGNKLLKEKVNFNLETPVYTLFYDNEKIEEVREISKNFFIEVFNSQFRKIFTRENYVDFIGDIGTKHQYNDLLFLNYFAKQKGDYTRFYDNGNLMLKGNYNYYTIYKDSEYREYCTGKNLKGLWSFYYPNGQLELQGEFYDCKKCVTDGEYYIPYQTKTGEWKEYFSDGTLKAEIFYEIDLGNSYCNEELKEPYEKVVYAKTYHKNGLLAEERTNYNYYEIQDCEGTHEFYVDKCRYQCESKKYYLSGAIKEHGDYLREKRDQDNFYSDLTYNSPEDVNSYEAYGNTNYNVKRIASIIESPNNTNLIKINDWLTFSPLDSTYTVTKYNDEGLKKSHYVSNYTAKYKEKIVAE